MTAPTDQVRTAPPPPPPPPPPPTEEKVHSVKAGESLESIGRDRGVDPMQIAERNGIDDPNLINEGAELVIPTPSPNGVMPTPATPVLTPEGQRVQNAVVDTTIAQSDLAAFDRMHPQIQGNPDLSDVRQGLADRVGTTQTELKAAVKAEVEADFAANSRPTGDILDAQEIQHRSQAIADRYADDPAAKAAIEAAGRDAAIDHEVQSTLSVAGAMPDAKGVVDHLTREIPKLSPEAQSRLLASPELDKLLNDRVAGYVNEPLNNLPDDRDTPGPGKNLLDSLARLDQVTRDADPRLATALADKTLDKIESLNLSDLAWSRTGTALNAAGVDPDRGILTLNAVAGRIAGTPEGDAQVARLAGVLDKAGGQGIRSLIDYAIPREGASPALVLAYAERTGRPELVDAAVQSVGDYARNGQLKSDIQAYAKETEELSWIISNYGGSATPEQLNQIITDYTKAKGPAWEQRVKELEAKVADDGLKLLGQIDQLRNLPPALAGRQGDVNAKIDELLGDQSAQFAVSLALKQHPEYIDTAAGRRLMQSYAYDAKVGEQSLKLGRELANAYVRQHVLRAAQNFDPKDPASLARANAAIDELKNPRFAALLGISESKLANAAEAMKQALPAAGDSAEVVKDKLAALDGKLTALDAELTKEGMKPAFDRKLPAGQLMRSLGLTFAAVGFANSTGKALDDPTLKNNLKAIVDGAGLLQKGTELAVGLGKISDDSLFGKFGSTTAGRVFGLLSAGFDGWSAGESFSQGDWVKGSLYTAGAAGGVLAAVSGTGLAASLGIGAWAGPVGLALVALSAIGLSIKDRVDASNVHHNETSAAALRTAGFNEATANALVDQSGEGWSPVPMLAKYAELKGYDLADPAQRQQFVDWVNGMPIDKLEHVRNWLHHTLDEYDGNVGQLGADRTVVLSQGTIVSQGGVATVMDTPRTVGQIDAMMEKYGATPLPTR